MGSQSYRDLVVWQQAIDLVELIYKTSESWPKLEAFGLTSQIRRAAVSVPTNISEGQGRNGDREFLHHLGIANGSLSETDTLVIIATRLGYISPDQEAAILHASRRVGGLLYGLMKSLHAQTSKQTAKD